MTRITPLLRPVLLASALTLGACAGSGTKNRGVESVHQPVVSRADYSIDLATSAGDLAPGEAQRLAGWLDGLDLGYGDRVAIDGPRGADHARDRIAAAVGGYGLLLADVAPMTPTAPPPGSLRIVVSRMSAHVPGCPDWSRTAGTNFDNHTWSNYGCATNVNMAAMVASPGDLVRGASGHGNDPATSYRAIDTYRKALPSGRGGEITKTETAGSGSSGGK